MAHRDRGVGRDRERGDLDDYRRRDAREPGRGERDFAPPTRGAPLNEFFVDGEGIHREVMQREICKYLGQDALSRPGTYNVRPTGGSAYSQNANYPPTSGYPPSSGFAAPGYTSTSGILGTRNEQNYIYSNQPDEYLPPGYPYQQSSMYPGAPQANPRTGAGYPYVTSPPDSTLRGVPMDDRGYDPYSQPMPVQSGRSGFPAPSRGTPTHFDPPQPRDGFGRAESSRDDRRRR
ncbi:MAG: hypothetical protein Q9216_000036 [Gyalolechia sp. 2 TL-2023]